MTKLSSDQVARDQSAALRQISPAEWASFGVQQVAYLRPMLLDGVLGVAIFAADGSQLGAAPNLAAAAAAVVEHDLAPVLVH